MTDPAEGRLTQPVIDLYDGFTHGLIGRRAFLDRLAALAGGAAAAAALLPLLQNDYARAATVPEGDPRLLAGRLAVEGGPAGLSGYLARPRDSGRHGAVLVIHENRGLNPHIMDVTRRLAVAGFVALGLDYLSPLGGTPADEDKARDMIGTLKAPDVTTWSRLAVAALRQAEGADGKVGAVGFCWGGGAVNALAVADPTLDAGVAYYGQQPPAADVPAIRAPLLLHYGGLDTRIDAGIPAYRSELEAAHKRFAIHVYEGANHAFNNDTSAERYDPAAAALAWDRTVAFLKETLA